MPSNSLTNRGQRLKRPIVCKSGPKAGCGACTFDVELNPDSIPVGGTIEIKCRLDCQPKPTTPTFTLDLKSAFSPLPPMPDFPIDTDFIWHAVAPMIVGSYRLKVSATNRDGCRFVSIQDCDVF